MLARDSSLTFIINSVIICDPSKNAFIFTHFAYTFADAFKSEVGYHRSFSLTITNNLLLCWSQNPFWVS